MYKLCLQRSASLHAAAVVLEDTTHVFCALEHGVKIRGDIDQNPGLNTCNILGCLSDEHS